jgi:acetyltransferase-like isoleucine patch superfamily enzyme
MTNSLVSKKFKNETFAAVHLGKHVIIGASAVVFPGVTVAEGCAIGAMALVTKSTAPWGVYAGIPARRVKDRERRILELEPLFLEEQALAGNS